MTQTHAAQHRPPLSERLFPHRRRRCRAQTGQFDRIVSVGMFEHVGVPFYRAYFDKIRSLLKDDGVALLHTIGRSGPPNVTDPWIRKYIFPGGYIPALSEVMPAIEHAGLVTTDVEFIGPHYAETLRAWWNRFQANRDKVKAMYDERFCRMWEYYLAGSEVSFRHMGMTLFQIQIVKNRESVRIKPRRTPRFSVVFLGFRVEKSVERTRELAESSQKVIPAIYRNPQTRRFQFFANRISLVIEANPGRRGFNTMTTLRKLTHAEELRQQVVELHRCAMQRQVDPDEVARISTSMISFLTEVTALTGMKSYFDQHAAAGFQEPNDAMTNSSSSTTRPDRETR